jgi:hypothetical protein
MVLTTIVAYVFITLSDTLGRVRTLKISILFIVAAALAAYFMEPIAIKVIGFSF